MLMIPARTADAGNPDSAMKKNTEAAAASADRRRGTLSLLSSQRRTCARRETFNPDTATRWDIPAARKSSWI